MSNFTILYYFALCLTMPSTKHHTIAFTLVNVPLVLPLCLYILRLGVRRWRSGSKISHTDFFTYNVVVLQLLTISGVCLLTIYIISLSDLLVPIGFFMLIVSYTAIVNFQIFTCLERYLAVVHPVAYLRLKSQTWALIRNITCGFVWLQCIIQTVSTANMQDLLGYYIFYLTILSLSFLIVLFCNVCVLRVLIRPQPGDGAKGNQTKQRALYMITAIMGTFMVKYSGDMLNLWSFLIPSSDYASFDKSCIMYFAVNWFTLPSTLVLPLLFLQRNGKLLCFKTNK